MIDGTVFDRALCGGTRWLDLDNSGPPQLPVARWHGMPDTGDELMLSRCQGPTLDIGCGPGRLTCAPGAPAARPRGQRHHRGGTAGPGGAQRWFAELART